MMKTVLLLLLGIIYLLLANALEAVLIKRLYLLIGLALVTVGAICYIKWRYDNVKMMTELKRASKETLKNIPHTHGIIANDGLHALLLNEHTNTLLLAVKEDWTAEITKKEAYFTEIYEVAIVEDDAIIASTNNGVFNNSLLEEEERLLVDEELEEEETDTDEVSPQLTLKIVVDNISTPIIEYVFLERDEAMSKEDDTYIEAMELCEQWYQKISIIIKRCQLDRVLIQK